MPHIIQTKSDDLLSPSVKVPWGRKEELRDAGLLDAVYETCKRADKGHCINTNFCRGFAKLRKRTIRAPATYKGAFHWSEFIDGRWCRFVAPLTLKYARRVDAYDHEGKHFHAPVKCPMGPVRFVGFSTERRDTTKQREVRREKMNARVEAGELVPGARFREPQAPYVAAQS